MAPIAMAAPAPATAPANAIRRVARGSSFAVSMRSVIHRCHKRKGRQIALPPPIRSTRMSYFRLVIAVRSADSLTMPVAPHQLEPKPPGLIAVMKAGLKLVVVWSLVKALHEAFDRLVSE